MAASVRQDTRDLTRTPTAKLRLRLVKGMRMVMRGLTAVQGWLLWLLGFFTRATTFRGTTR